MSQLFNRKTRVMGWVLLAVTVGWGAWMASFSANGTRPPYFDAGFVGWIVAMSVLLPIAFACMGPPPPGSKGAAIDAARTQGQRLWRLVQTQILIEAVLVAAACFVTWLMRGFVDLQVH